jgi:hypothetical protein
MFPVVSGLNRLAKERVMIDFSPVPECKSFLFTAIPILRWWPLEQWALGKK